MSIQPVQSQATGRGFIPVDSFGNRLMLARAHAGHISIREAADLCNIGRGAWTNWEKGARPSDILEVAAIVADKLGVDRDWLLFGGQLSQAGSRQMRRGGVRVGVTEQYPAIAVQSPSKARPGNNRPSGRAGTAPSPTSARTAYVERTQHRGPGR